MSLLELPSGAYSGPFENFQNCIIHDVLFGNEIVLADSIQEFINEIKTVSESVWDVVALTLYDVDQNVGRLQLEYWTDDETIIKTEKTVDIKLHQEALGSYLVINIKISSEDLEVGPNYIIELLNALKEAILINKIKSIQAVTFSNIITGDLGSLSAEISLFVLGKK